MHDWTKQFYCVALRNWEPGTGATITFEADKTLSLVKALTKLHVAVAEWLAEDAAGQAAWEASSEDFNWGDLSMEQSDEQLIRVLASHGIDNLKIETFSSDGPCVEYDEVFRPTKPKKVR